MFRLFRSLAAGVTGAALLCGPAKAHSFQSGAGAYQEFLEGGQAIVVYPGILLPLVALGLLLGLWDREGMVRAWPAFLVGLLAGVPVAVAMPPSVAVVMIALGLFVATLTALLSRHWRAEALALSFVTGLLAMAVSLEGHGFLELSVFIHLGLFATMNLVVAASAGLVRVSTDRFEMAWVRILWRVVASWIAAILVLYLAFLGRGA